MEFGDAECTVSTETWVQAEEKARQGREGKWAQDDWIIEWWFINLKIFIKILF